MSERLKGQVAIVTGAGRELRQFCALGFANEGARVVIAARYGGGERQKIAWDDIPHGRDDKIPIVCNIAD